MIKVLKRSGIPGFYLNLIKAIYSKPIANIKLNGEKFKVIPLKSDKAVHSLHVYSAYSYGKQLGIGIKIDRLINGIESKTSILIPSPVNT